MTHKTPLQNATDLWGKIDSIVRQLEDLSNDMDDFKEEPFYKHFTFMLIAKHPYLNEHGKLKGRTRVTALASQRNVADMIGDMIGSLEDISKKIERGPDND